MIRLLRHDKNMSREEEEGAVRFDDLIEEFKVKFVGTLQRTVDAWVGLLAEGRGEKKIFQYCLNPYSSDEFLYFRAIQGHSRNNAIVPTLQHNVLLPDDFAEHTRNALHYQKWTEPRRKGLIRDRQSVFFTTVNPMCARQDLEEGEYDRDKPRIASYKHTWRAYHNTLV